MLLRGHDAKFYVHFCFFKSALLAYCELGAIHTLPFMSYILTKLTAQCLWTLVLFSAVDSIGATISNIFYTSTLEVRSCGNMTGIHCFGWNRKSNRTVRRGLRCTEGK